jgi:AcrR family transcriptional regulator
MPASMRRRRRLSLAERRELILDGAMEVFAERGYEGASMCEIARAGGVTPAVIYDHFPSKAQLAIELLERETGALLGHEEHRFAWRMLFRDPPLDPEVAAYRRLNHQATLAIAVFLETGGSEALATYENPAEAAEIFAGALKAAQKREEQGAIASALIAALTSAAPLADERTPHGRRDRRRTRQDRPAAGGAALGAG